MFEYICICVLLLLADLVLSLLSNSSESEKLQTLKALEDGLEDIKKIAENYKQQIITDDKQQ